MPQLSATAPPARAARKQQSWALGLVARRTQRSQDARLTHTSFALTPHREGCTRTHSAQNPPSPHPPDCRHSPPSAAAASSAHAVSPPKRTPPAALRRILEDLPAREHQTLVTNETTSPIEPAVIHPSTFSSSASTQTCPGQPFHRHTVSLCLCRTHRLRYPPWAAPLSGGQEGQSRSPTLMTGTTPKAPRLDDLPQVTASRSFFVAHT